MPRGGPHRYARMEPAVHVKQRSESGEHKIKMRSHLNIVAFSASVACKGKLIRALARARTAALSRRAPGAAATSVAGASLIAAVRSSCAFRAALPASGTSQCGECVRGGECGFKRFSSHVTRDGCRACGTGRAGGGRRPRCHGAARAWRARSEGPEASVWVMRTLMIRTRVRTLVAAPAAN